MTIVQSSGAISVQEINTEFGLGTNLNAYRGTNYWATNSTSGTFPTGGISMWHFYTKAKNRPTFNIEYVVVGGGGAGGPGYPDNYGGGGGGGGGGMMKRGSVGIYYNIANTVTIGAGGVASDTYTTSSTAGGSSGLTTSVGTQLTAYGGQPGHGAIDGNYNGGSSGDFLSAGGGYNTPGVSSAYMQSGGGGGGGVDDANSSAPGGAGGSWNVFYFAGGGGGGSDYSVGGAGGRGGGGQGGSNVWGTSGTANTGGGGGGGGSSSSWTPGGQGGTGVVLIRYPGGNQLITGGAVQIMGGYVYHTFTSNTTFIINH